MPASLSFVHRPRNLARMAVVIGAALLVVVNLTHGSAGSARPPETPAEVEAFVRAQVADAGIPGAALAIVQDGHAVDLAGIGTADASGRPVTPDTPFAIGSLTKSMTALAVYQLVEAGELDLDGPVARYLPWFHLDGDSGPSPITVRELLDQTSGISTSAGRSAFHGPVTSLDAQVRGLATVPAQSEPGTAFAYSNMNYAALGLVVEKVSGEPFGRYLDEHLFRPLGMTDTFTDLESARAAGLGDAHRLVFGLPIAETPFYRPDLVPAGFVFSTARDMARYLAMELGGGELDGVRVLSATGIRQLQTGAVDTGLGGNRYGMGWFEGSTAGVPVVWHDGSTGDMASIAVMVPSQHLGVVLLANAQSPLYELLMKPESIGFAAAALLAGHDPEGTLGFLYPAFDLLVLALVVIQLRALWRAVRRSPHGEPHFLAPIRRRVPAWLWPLVTSGLLPVLVLLRLPAFFDAPWSLLVQTDIGFAALSIALLRIAVGAVRLGWWIAGRAAGRRGEASTAASGSVATWT